jgi:hypothetical protein
VAQKGLLANRAFENMAKLKCLGPTVRDENLIHEEIKSRLYSGNVCYRSVQNLLFCRLLPKDVTFKICKINSSLVLYVYETWSLALREEHRLRVFENRVLRRIFGLKGVK